MREYRRLQEDPPAPRASAPERRHPRRRRAAADRPQPARRPAPIPRRLVYLGTPAMAVPPLQALVTSGWDVALVVTGVDTRRGPGSATSPSPVKAAALELGLPGRSGSRRCSSRRRPRRRGRLRPADPAPRPRAPRLRQPPLLAPAPLAGAAPVDGRSWPATPRPVLPDAPRGGARHRAGVRPPAVPDRLPCDRRDPARQLVGSGPSCSSRPSRRARSPQPQKGEADLRREAHAGRLARDRLGRGRPTPSTTSCAWRGVDDVAGAPAEGPRRRAGGRGSGSRWTSRVGSTGRRPDAGRRRGGHRVRVGCACSRSSPEGKAAMARRGLAPTALHARPGATGWGR